MTMSRIVSILWNRSNLVGMFYSNNKLLTSPSSSTLNISCLYLSVTKKTKQQLRDSNCYTSKVFLAELVCIILDITSPGNNLCTYLCEAQGVLSAGWKAVWLRIHKKPHHCHYAIHDGFIIRLWNTHTKLLQVQVRPACPHLPDSGNKHCPTCTDRDGRWDVHSKLNNIAISSVINEGVNVFCYTFAGVSSGFVKLVLNRITVIVS